MKTIAKIISAVTSPYLIIPIFSSLTIFHFSKNPQEFLLWLSILVIFVVMLPFGYVFILVWQKKITDFHVFLKEQRLVPFIVAIIGSIVLLMIYYLLKVPRELILMAIALTINGTVFGFASNYWKLSLHSATYTSSVLIFALLVNSFWIVLLLMLPLIFWARLVRGRHNIHQLIIAAIVSGAITTLIIELFK